MKIATFDAKLASAGTVEECQDLAKLAHAKRMAAALRGYDAGPWDDRWNEACNKRRRIYHRGQ